MPMILETPAEQQETWAAEIKMLYNLVGKKAGDLEMLEWEEKLQESGSHDRKKQLEALAKKELKRKKMAPQGKKSKKSSGSSSEEESDESDSISEEEE